MEVSVDKMVQLGEALKAVTLALKLNPKHKGKGPGGGQFAPGSGGGGSSGGGEGIPHPSVEPPEKIGSDARRQQEERLTGRPAGAGGAAGNTLYQAGKPAVAPTPRPGATPGSAYYQKPATGVPVQSPIEKWNLYWNDPAAVQRETSEVVSDLTKMNGRPPMPQEVTSLLAQRKQWHKERVEWDALGPEGQREWLNKQPHASSPEAEANQKWKNKRQDREYGSGQAGRVL